jgi:hypothetical protein
MHLAGACHGAMQEIRAELLTIICGDIINIGQLYQAARVANCRPANIFSFYPPNIFSPGAFRTGITIHYYCK